METDKINKINKMVALMKRTDKINFLMRSNLFELNTLIEKSETELNDLTKVGLEATGFKFKNEV
ncbi:hypothetical protein KKG81_00265 [bacterium]|nr:hypothetical protein [bacterium]